MSNANSKGRPYKILVVEDNDDDLKLFLRALQKVQADLEIEIDAYPISNGTEAAARLKEQKFDAIFLDFNLPPPDGVELTNQIRRSEMNRTTPVVIITGAEARGLMTRAFEAGASLFLFKPIDRGQLLRLIQVARVPIDRERHKFQRVKVKCKVSIESGEDRFDGKTIDLSLSGMLVHASRVLPVGSNINVSLTFPQATTPTRMAARVVRIIGNEFMGLHLESMGKTETEKLGEILIPLIAATVE